MATVETNIEAHGVNGQVPLLYAGDHLTRAEFERRYEAMPECRKAELIEGVVYMSSPVSLRHSDSHFEMISWLGLYCYSTPGVKGGDNGTLRLDLENEPQPDAFLRILPEFGGQTYNSGNYVGGAPELVGEVAVSSASYDLHEKLRAYQRNGVLEYIVWRIDDKTIDWFVLRDDRFQRLEVDPHGNYCSHVFPGLWLDPAAMLRSDVARVLAVIQEGLATAEHAQFVDRLRQVGAESGS